uniref:SH3 domain-containing protein n=1 Tax=Caenorhabditis japonica TaxID=281687 RepID=A0A8R1IAY6_CAEJA
MSRFHVPVPDYDFTVRQKNPYIPTPDYTFKYSKQKNRPSLNNIGTEFAAKPVIYEAEISPITIPVEVPPQFSVQKETNFQKPSKLERHSVPRLPDNNNYPVIKKHSYIEDHENEERHISTKEHIKQIGVPVLPGIATPVCQAQPFEVSPVASDQNRAFLRHLENHKKFDDTSQGDRGTNDCEICQIMRKSLETENANVHSRHHSWEENRQIAHSPNQNSNPRSRKKRGDVRGVFSRIEEQREPEPYFRAISAHARHNYEMRREGEISIHAMEKVDILHMEQEFSLCRKADNTIGWIPSSVFE